jgi:uncharacterized protein
MMSAAQAAKANEPTMEEILASIRQIISDEPAKPQAAAPANAPAVSAVPPPAPPVIQHAPVQPMPAPEPTMAAMTVEDDILDLIAPQRAARPVPTPQQSFAALTDAVASDRLLSTTADQAASASFGNLAHTVLAQNGRTLDDVVYDLLKPMLKSWLDDHLPTIVERLVRSEIERVARGGR